MGKRLRKGKVRDHKHKREHRDAEKGKKTLEKVTAFIWRETELIR